MIDEEHQPYDRSSKWLIQHYGDSILWLAKIGNIQGWRPAQAEVVQPRQLPEGLLEVRLQDESRDDLFLLEVATYPERRVGEQLARDLMLVYLDRGELPEAVTLVLRPRGKYRIPRRRHLHSRRGTSACSLKWHVVELWTVPAEELLAAQDVGLIPWVPLTDSSDPPETLLRRCRESIERQAPAEEKDNLLAVTQVLAYLRYNDIGLLEILGGTQAMIKSPLMDLLFAEKERDVVRRCILTSLDARFGDIPGELAESIAAVADEEQLQSLLRKAAACPDLQTFCKEI